jgi:hypothetical protein
MFKGCMIHHEPRNKFFKPYDHTIDTAVTKKVVSQNWKTTG